MVKLSAIQLSSTPNVEENLATIEKLLSLLDKDSHHLVVLPECCLFFGGRDVDQLSLAKENIHTNHLINSLSNLAKKYQVNLAAGSIPLAYQGAEKTIDKFTNSCCLFSSSGEQLARYDKIHLFDVDVASDKNAYCESRFTHAGDQIEVLTLGELTVGFTICYDLRFPELFRQLAEKGANVIIVPSAFTKTTGRAHWETLLRARAIENQVYIIAAGQCGKHQNGRETWGHSMIINPWGEIIASLNNDVGHISIDVCLDEINKIRNAMPVATHNRFTVKIK